MPLREIDPNTVVIPHLPPLLQTSPSLKRKRSESSPGKSKGTQDLFDALRSAVVTLRLLNKDAFKIIEEKTGVKERIAAKIVRQAKEEAQSDDFIEILVCFSNKKNRIGRPPVIFDGGEDSARLRIAILQDFTTEWEEVVKKQGFNLARSIVENVAKKHRDSQHSYAIKWVIRSEKSHLSSYDEDLRLEYCLWALERLEEGVIFIFIDESYIDIGGPPRKKAKASRSVGFCAEAVAIVTSFVQFAVMLWGGCCEDQSISRPFYIWVLPEFDEERKKHNEEFEEENKIIKTKREEQQRRALISHIKEYSELQEINVRIAAHNAAVKARGENKNGKGLYRIRKPEQVFKYEALERGQGRGIDWFLYRKYILRPHLYPYYQAVVKVNPHRQVFFVEDNAGPHQKAQRITAEERDELNIKMAPHPFNSPDLHPIETIFNYIKDSLEEYNLGDYEVDQAAQEHAKAIILKEWKKYQGAAVTAICKGFKDKLWKCIQAQGSNRFHD